LRKQRILADSGLSSTLTVLFDDVRYCYSLSDICSVIYLRLVHSALILSLDLLLFNAAMLNDARTR
jgi:hypothetical protein